jgi:hypothetical protein
MPRHRSLRFPEIGIDLNARIDGNTYVADLPCTRDSLQRLGLTLETALGKSFAFVDISGTVNDSGAPDDLMFYGVIAHRDGAGYIAQEDGNGLFYRSGHVDA